MKSEDLKTLAGRIEYICYVKKLKQSELANILGVSSTAIYKITSGATINPSMDLLINFYQKLGVDLLWLATGVGQMDADKCQKPNGADSSTGVQAEVEKLENRIEELVDQVGLLKYTVNLQRKMLEQSQTVLSVGGKSKGVTVRPLSNSMMSFEEMMSLYKKAALGEIELAESTHHFFLHPQLAKLVAPWLAS